MIYSLVIIRGIVVNRTLCLTVAAAEDLAFERAQGVCAGQTYAVEVDGERIILRDLSPSY